jgi:inosine/xanthosine triphosphate pyrophosphatase family protein
VTFNQLEPSEKHRISHRGRAAAAAVEVLRRMDRHG